VAFNERDVKACLSSYAEDAKYTDVVSPAWRVLTKSELGADVETRFPKTAFESSTALPLTDGFFVSADGRYAAVQGIFKDAGTAGATLPMLVILELEDGRIVRQYNLMLADRSML